MWLFKKNIRHGDFWERGQKKLFLSRKGYIEKILSRFGISKTKTINTSSAVNSHFSFAFATKSTKEKEYMARVPYIMVV